LPALFVHVQLPFYKKELAPVTDEDTEAQSSCCKLHSDGEIAGIRTCVLCSQKVSGSLHWSHGRESSEDRGVAPRSPLS
jgi:hypothetical protein